MAGRLAPPPPTHPSGGGGGPGWDPSPPLTRPAPGQRPAPARGRVRSRVPRPTAGLCVPIWLICRLHIRSGQSPRALTPTSSPVRLLSSHPCTPVVSSTLLLNRSAAHHRCRVPTPTPSLFTMGAAVLLSTGIARIVMYVCLGRTARGVAPVGRVGGCSPRRLHCARCYLVFPV